MEVVKADDTLYRTYRYRCSIFFIWRSTSIITFIVGGFYAVCDAFRCFWQHVIVVRSSQSLQFQEAVDGEEKR